MPVRAWTGRTGWDSGHSSQVRAEETKPWVSPTPVPLQPLPLPLGQGPGPLVPHQTGPGASQVLYEGAGELLLDPRDPESQ